MIDLIFDEVVFETFKPDDPGPGDIFYAQVFVHLKYKGKEVFSIGPKYMIAGDSMSIKQIEGMVKK